MSTARTKAKHGGPNRPHAWWAPVRVLLSILIVFLSALSGFPATAQQKPKKILILFSSSNRNFQDLNDIESALRAVTSQPVDFHVEYLDGRRLDDQEYEEGLVEVLGHTYREVNLDLVFLQSLPALKFATRNHDTLFPGVPIIFIDVDSGSIEGMKMGPGVTGVAPPMGIHASVNLALQLHPNANTVAIISAGATNDEYFLSRIHSELLHQRKVRVIDLVGLPSSQLLEKIAALPPQTVVFFQLTPSESVQPAMGVHDILARVSQRLPTYSLFPYNVVGFGGVGGVSYDWQSEVSVAAQMAKQVFSGKRPEDIPVIQYARPQVVVDWRELQRWHIPESALPAGSLVLYRQPTFWERDRNYILAAIAVIVAQALLIASLLWQRYRKRRAEAVLRESEERFRVMADSAPALVWMCDEHGKITYLNERWIAYAGPDPDAGYGDTWLTFIHPDDVKNVLSDLWKALKDQKSFSKEYRLHRSDGVYRWMFDVASPRFNGDGTFAGFIGSAIDVTDQKLAQQALEQVSGRLIEAQEKERTRIARDLHDDICQRLALLSMELEQAKRDSTGRVSATKNLEDIRQHCCEIAEDVQSLSHQLHSSKLDYLGIVAAIEGFCREVAKQHNVTVDFAESNVPQCMAKDVSLCLFRVAQESLHNAIKYSGTDQFKVHLSATADQVRLEVTDAGAGFDLEETKKNRGLGLVSMQERVHLVHGRLAVESKPGMGTKVIAAVPLADENGHTTEDETAKRAASLRETS